MPKIILHIPAAAFDAYAMQTIAAELTDLMLECEGLPTSQFARSTVWSFFNEYDVGSVFVGGKPAVAKVIGIEVFVVEDGLNEAAKKKLIEGTTAIFGRHLEAAERFPVWIFIHEVPESDYGIFGKKADLAALRTSLRDAPAF